MTEATGSQNQSSQSSNPWERAWNTVTEAVTNVGNMVKDAVLPSEGAPWEKQWSDPKPPEKPRAVPPSKFDTVFNNLIQAESGGNHSAVSNKGAKGITQVMPKTGVDPGYGVKPLQNNSEAEYKRFGREYLQAMLTRFDGDYEKALAAYNAGVGHVQAAVERGGKNWKKHLPKPSETLPYIEKILGKVNG